MSTGPQQNRSHEWIDQRSLAMHMEIAQMIQEKPELLDRAKATLARWIKNSHPPSPAKLEWDAILKNSTTEEILSLLTRWDEDARRLRQSSPFCGILPEEQRLAIFAEFEQRLEVPDTTVSTPTKSIIKDSCPPDYGADYQRALVEAFGKEWAAICNLSYDDRVNAIARVWNKQGESPRDRAWPTEGGNEPLPEEGWDPTGSFRPDVVRQVYVELIQEGKIKMSPSPASATTDNQATTTTPK